MARKNKTQRAKKENALPLVLISLAVGVLALLQNKYGRASDIYGFYGMHFYDGQHLWPFSEKILEGDTTIQHPVEYPALTGLIMWLISFLVSPSPTAIYSYYRITAAFQIVLFSICAYLLFKLSQKKYSYYFVLAPAVLYSLNRNWDIWAMAAMLLSIYLFEKKRFQLSAILLAVSIATKFFPIVLMLPIMVILLRNRQISIFIKYSLTTLSTWLMINLPFALINFDGWAYFYKFSAERGLGSASFYEITSILIPMAKFNSVHFYILNLITLILVTYFLLKLKSIPNLSATSFFVMFGFILFNKQYSMQYVIWLSALAVISMPYLKKQHQDLLIYVYVLWQASELAFQYSFFQKLLTDVYANSATPMTIAVSNTTFAYVGVVRYFLAVVFALLLARFLYLKNSEDVATKDKSGF
jgi:uncharacterized membrane protein